MGWAPHRANGKEAGTPGAPASALWLGRVAAGRPRGRSGTALGVLSLEADEVEDVQNGLDGGAVAVGVGAAPGELVLEADEIRDVEDRSHDRAVAVGVAGR